jgi:protein CpxP
MRTDVRLVNTPRPLAALLGAAVLSLGLAGASALAQPLPRDPAGHAASPSRDGHAMHHGMRGMQAHPGAGFGPAGYLFHPRALEAVGATAEQKAQLQQILASARADLRALRDTGASQREQARSLFAQPQVDARTAEALRQQMMARQDQASRRMLQAALEASRVLSPEQRQQLAQHAAEHQARQGQRQEHMRQRLKERRGAQALPG